MLTLSESLCSVPGKFEDEQWLPLWLPRVLCRESVIGKTVHELEAMDRKYIPEWREAPMLRGELILLFDDDLTARIGDFKLIYNRETGISYKEGADENDD